MDHTNLLKLLIGLSYNQLLKPTEYICLYYITKENKENYNIISIRDVLYTDLKIDIPLSNIKGLIEKLIKKGYVLCNTAPITEHSNISIKDSTDNTENTIEEIYKLISDISDINDSDIINYLFSFCFLEVDLNTFKKIITDYNLESLSIEKVYNITQTLSRQPEIKEIYTNLIFHAVLYWRLFSHKDIELIDIPNNNTEIYLDLPLVFSALGYHSEFNNNSTKELLLLLKEFKFTITIPFYIQELFIKRISYYKKKLEKHEEIDRDDFEFALYTKHGCTDPKQVDLIIENFAEELQKLEIRVLQDSNRIIDFIYIKDIYKNSKIISEIYMRGSLMGLENAIQAYYSGATSLQTANLIFLSTNREVLQETEKFIKNKKISSSYIKPAYSPIHIMLFLFHDKLSRSMPFDIILATIKSNISKHLNDTFYNIFNKATNNNNKHNIRYSISELNESDKRLLEDNINAIAELPEDSEIKQKIESEHINQTLTIKKILHLEDTIKSDNKKREKELNKIKKTMSSQNEKIDTLKQQAQISNTTNLELEQQLQKEQESKQLLEKEKEDLKKHIELQNELGKVQSDIDDTTKELKSIKTKINCYYAFLGIISVGTIVLVIYFIHWLSSIYEKYEFYWVIGTGTVSIVVSFITKILHEKYTNWKKQKEDLENKLKELKEHQKKLETELYEIINRISNKH